MSLDYAALFEQGLSYEGFLQEHATDSQRQRWGEVHAQVQLRAPQQELLQGFVREMKVAVLAGAWCGDCVNQCPIFDRFAAANDRIRLRFFDRDRHPELAQQLTTCGGSRVPAVLFLSEDDHVCGRYGDRTLATYRHLAATQLGPSCPTGIGGADQDLLAEVTQQWLDEFERIQLMLRMSTRLREKHGD
jgi:thiol-disulfide isomerase/thioredoxin